MSNDKVQGEGDYKSARRFEKEESKFVKEHTKGGKEIMGSADEAPPPDQLTPAEREGLSHAKSPEQDKRDAKVMRDLGKKKK